MKVSMHLSAPLGLAALMLSFAPGCQLRPIRYYRSWDFQLMRGLDEIPKAQAWGLREYFRHEPRACKVVRTEQDIGYDYVGYCEWPIYYGDRFVSCEVAINKNTVRHIREITVRVWFRFRAPVARALSGDTGVMAVLADENDDWVIAVMPPVSVWTIAPCGPDYLDERRAFAEVGLSRLIIRTSPQPLPAGRYRLWMELEDHRREHLLGAGGPAWFHLEVAQPVWIGRAKSNVVSFRITP